MPEASESSRLHKLLHLLENGRSDATRKAAAKQVTEIAKSHPEQLPSILRKVQHQLTSKVWEGRVAAGEVVGLIADHFSHNDVAELRKALSDEDQQALSATTKQFSVDFFDLDVVLTNGQPLTASGGQEYDLPLDSRPADQRLAAQLGAIKQKLGLAKGLDNIIDTSELIKEEDLELPAGGQPPSPTAGGAGVRVKAAAMDVLGSMGGLSARERNKLKRKARHLQRSDSIKSQGSAASGFEPLPSCSSVKDTADSAGSGVPARPAASVASDAAAAAAEDAAEWKRIVEGGWPLQRVMEQLLVDVVNPNWEQRHGAALALREVLRAQAGAAGVVAPVAGHTSGWCIPGTRGRRQLQQQVQRGQVEAAAEANREVLQDAVVVLLCVLALDRFVDYGSDQVVAPVQETAAQALGAALVAVDPAGVSAVLAILKRLVQHDVWSVRYGGLLGIKYLLASRLELAGGLLPAALPALKEGLLDREDDVRAAAADALVPVAPVLVEAFAEAVDGVRALLWGVLAGLDELSAATGSVMHLLAALYSQQAGSSCPAASAELQELVPRLWPFLRHSMASVRLACVRCLSNLLKAGSGQEEGGWVGPLVRPLLELLYQNVVMESEERLLQHTEAAWQLLLQAAPPATLQASVDPPLLQRWLTLASTPTNQNLDPTLLVVPRDASLIPAHTAAPPPAPAPRRTPAAPPPNKRSRLQRSSAPPANTTTLSTEATGPPTYLPPTPVTPATATRMRLSAARCIAQLLRTYPPAPPCPLLPSLQPPLASHSAYSRLVTSLTTWFLFTLPPATDAAPPLPPAIITTLLAYLSAQDPSFPTPNLPSHYTELAPLYVRATKEVEAVLTATHDMGWILHTYENRPINALTLQEQLDVISQVPPDLDPTCLAVASKLRAETTLLDLLGVQAYLHSAVLASLAAAYVGAGQLPPKFNTVIQPLMASIRKEPEAGLQRVSAAALAHLLLLCRGRRPNPSDKLIRNICAMAAADPAAAAGGVPEAVAAAAAAPPAADDPADDAGAAAAAAAAAAPLAPAAAVARAGAEAALRAVCAQFGAGVVEAVPAMWAEVEGPLRDAGEGQPPRGDLTAVVGALQVLRIIGPELHSDLLAALLGFLPRIAGCLRHPRGAVRVAAALAAADLAAARPAEVMPPLLNLLVPMLYSSGCELARRGAVQAALQLATRLELALVPYVSLLLVPLLRRMADPVLSVRLPATTCFGILVGLLPLAQGQPPPPGLDAKQLEAVQADSEFLMQLLDSRQAADYQVPVDFTVKLRGYQQEGVNWLAFLRRFGLHGVLADDMGLGKTLQATLIMAAAAHDQAQQYEQTRRREDAPLPSLVVCPSTLVPNWAHEVSRFVAPEALRPIQYSGTPAERSVVQAQVPTRGRVLVVMSYEALRADVDWVAARKWSYCVLDEGHIIRSPKSKITQACKRVPAQQRLILTGTPIQNSLAELWSLFDFLMPGFLGTEAAFNAKYGRAVQAARGSKRGSREAEAGLLAAEALHKQVMPFVLRRTKQGVLHDLPPKILQDITCPLSHLQQLLYEDFTSSQEGSGLLDEDGVPRPTEEGSGQGQKQHVFRTLLYLRKLCSHPLMVLDSSNAAHRSALQQATGTPDWEAGLAAAGALHHAPKLLALRDLLSQCGIIAPQDSDPCDGPPSSAAPPEADPTALNPDAGGHRLLVFAQLKETLDLAQRLVLQPLGVGHLRLDGGVDPQQRFGIVQQFNSDPTIDVLLLTTQVGGLGLNLTSADTVVFLEHDWNPQKDLQAMDRAHRLGQTRSVSVFRLLMRGTLEERILSLQRFKIEVAETVVSADNASMGSMDTTRLLDILADGKGGTEGAGDAGRDWGDVG